MFKNLISNNDFSCNIDFRKKKWLDKEGWIDYPDEGWPLWNVVNHNNKNLNIYKEKVNSRSACIYLNKETKTLDFKSLNKGRSNLGIYQKILIKESGIYKFNFDIEFDRVFNDSWGEVWYNFDLPVNGKDMNEENNAIKIYNIFNSWDQNFKCVTSENFKYKGSIYDIVKNNKNGEFELKIQKPTFIYIGLKLGTTSLYPNKLRVTNFSLIKIKNLMKENVITENVSTENVITENFITNNNTDNTLLDRIIKLENIIVMLNKKVNFLESKLRKNLINNSKVTTFENKDWDNSWKLTYHSFDQDISSNKNAIFGKNGGIKFDPKKKTFTFFNTKNGDRNPWTRHYGFFQKIKINEVGKYEITFKISLSKVNDESWAEVWYGENEPIYNKDYNVTSNAKKIMNIYNTWEEEANITLKENFYFDGKINLLSSDKKDKCYFEINKLPKNNNIFIGIRAGGSGYSDIFTIKDIKLFKVE